MGRLRMFKAAVVLITLGYCSLLVYQAGVTYNFQDNRLGSLQADFVTSETTTITTNATVSDSGRTKSITLDDIFISVKTSNHYHQTRLPVIINTWFQLAKEQTWFFTDMENKALQNTTNGHLINTNCSDTHERKHLCCKTAVEYESFLQSGKKWWCHFDDDNYVNVPRLVAKLQEFDPQEDWYLGRNSVKGPIEVIAEVKQKSIKRVFSTFWFGTFGAGVCISRSLALKIVPIASGGKFISVCEKLRYPDDLTMGYIITNMLRVNMTYIPEFHSHLEQLKLLSLKTLREHITFGYDIRDNFQYDSDHGNAVNVPGFDARYDPTRFLSLHCFLFPHFEFCPR